MSKFIVLEGTDGSGKSTQLGLLCEKLNSLGMKYTKLTFPRYDEPSSALLKMYLNGDFGDDPASVNPYAASTFFSVDRYASFMTSWRDAYEHDEIIVSDRYTTSNAIHQAGKLEGAERDEYLSWLFDFEYRLLGLPCPDSVIFLDMPAEESFRLIRDRHGSSDIHEADNKYLIRCRENALDICERYGWRRVPCADAFGVRAPEDIGKDVYSIACEVLGIG